MSKSSIGIIGGADGPTSVFVAGKKPTLRRRFRKWKRERRFDRLAQKTVTPHTTEELAKWLEAGFGAKKLSEAAPEYCQICKNRKAAYVMREQPELLKTPQLESPSIDLKNPDKKALELYMEQVMKRQTEAEAVPDELIPMKLEIYEFSFGKKSGRMCVEMEHIRQEMGVSYSTDGKDDDGWRLMREIYRYFGFSRKDAAERSDRFRQYAMMMERPPHRRKMVRRRRRSHFFNSESR